MSDTIAANQTFLALDVPFDAKELYRLVWCPADSERVVLIRIKQLPLDRQAPLRISRQVLVDAIAAGHLKYADYRPAPETLMTDEELNARANSKRRRALDMQDTDADCSKVAYRKRWWPIIEPILLQLEAVWQGQASLGLIIAQSSKKSNIGRQLVYLRLYQCLAHGGSRSALFPNQSGKQGGYQVPRIGKGKRLGRKTLTEKHTGKVAGNFMLSVEDIVTMQAFWRRHVRRDTSVPDAYNLYLDTYWTDHYEHRHARAIAFHRPPSERPSLMQFRTPPFAVTNIWPVWGSWHHPTLRLLSGISRRMA